MPTYRKLCAIFIQGILSIYKFSLSLINSGFRELLLVALYKCNSMLRHIVGCIMAVRPEHGRPTDRSLLLVQSRVIAQLPPSSLQTVCQANAHHEAVAVRTVHPARRY